MKTDFIHGVMRAPPNTISSVQKNLIGFLLIVFFCGSCSAPNKWQKFISPDKDFEVSAPGQLVSIKPAPDAVPTVLFQLEASDKTYGIYFHVKRADFPPGTLAGLSSTIVDSALDSVRDQDVSASHGQLVSESPITLGSNPGRELRISSDAGKTVGTERLYIVGDRIYAILAVRKPSDEADAAVVRFLDSFHLTNQ